MYLSINQMINNDTISTTMRVTKTATFRYVRLRLFKWDTPDGTLTLTFKDGATSIGSATLALADLTTEVGSYFHGYIRLDLGDAGMRVNVPGTVTYKELNVELALTSHTDDSVNYIGWCKNFEGAFVDSYGTTPDGNSAAQLTHFQPYGIEVFANK